jgi:hypothetical protein
MWRVDFASHHGVIAPAAGGKILAGGRKNWL